jgi:hypothetical protein
VAVCKCVRVVVYASWCVREYASSECASVHLPLLVEHGRGVEERIHFWHGKARTLARRAMHCTQVGSSPIPKIITTAKNSSHLALSSECLDVDSASHERKHVIGKVPHASLERAGTDDAAKMASSAS